MAEMTKDFIFYHVPKTGGTWVKTALKNAGLKLVTLRPVLVHAEFPHIMYSTHAAPCCISEKDKASRWSFCVFRDPVDWYWSFWCDYMGNTGLDRRGKSELGKLLCDDFDVFVNAVLDKYPSGFLRMLYLHYKSVDEFCYTRHLKRDLVHILDLHGIEYDRQALINTPLVNVTGKKRAMKCQPGTWKRIVQVEGQWS
jgi:hypothetical protein